MFRAIINWICATGASGSPPAPGAVAIRVGVSYRSDPDQVRAILERVAAECPFLDRERRASVTFDDFGPSALEFSLKATAADPEQRAVAETDLRTRILKTLRASGVEMPYAQHDIHIRDLDAVREILSRVALERATKFAETPDKGRPPAGGAPGAPRRDAG